MDRKEVVEEQDEWLQKPWSDATFKVYVGLVEVWLKGAVPNAEYRERLLCHYWPMKVAYGYITPKQEKEFVRRFGSCG